MMEKPGAHTMETELHRLSVFSRQPGAVFRVTDGRSARVGTGMYRLDLDLPPGIYTVSAMLGASIESKTVLLDHSRAVEMDVVHGSFGDAAYAMAPRIRALIAPSSFGAGASTVVAVRGPFAEAPARVHRISLDADGREVAADAEDTITDDAGGIWTWQLFRPRLQPGKPGIVTATRTVDGTPTSHVIPVCGDETAWTTWASYPAPAEVAAKGADLPLSYYVRLRLAAPGVAPDLALQCLSDQVFTALANRSALPFSEPVLDLLFTPDADPLLALAAAHLVSLKLAWYELVARLPQDEAIGDGGKADLARASDETQEPVPPTQLRARVQDWIRQVAQEFADRPDVVAVKYLYGMCDEDVTLDRPPVLLRSLDALIAAEHAAAARGRYCQLGDRVWRSRFQVSDGFAFLQWEKDAKRGEKKRLEQLEQSFAASQALQRSLDELRLRQARTVPESGTAAAAGAAGSADSSDGAGDVGAQRAPQQVAPTTAEAVERATLQALRPQRFSGDFLERAEQAAALGRQAAADALADLTGSTRMRARATREFEAYLKLNAQALRVPSSAIDGLAQKFGKLRAKLKK